MMKMTHWVLAALLAPGIAACKDTDRNVELERAEAPTRPSEVRDFDDDDDRASARLELEDRGLETDTAPSMGADPNVNKGAGSDGLTQNDSTIGERGHAPTAMEQQPEVDETTVQLTAVGPGGEASKIDGRARVLPAAGGEWRLTVDVHRADAGEYAVRFASGDCGTDPKQIATRGTELGTLTIEENGRGQLVTTLPEGSGLAHGEQGFDQRSIVLVPKQTEGAAGEIACGVISVPAEDHAG